MAVDREAVRLACLNAWDDGSWYDCADAAIKAVLDGLAEPSEEMDIRGCEADHGDWSDSKPGDQSDSIIDIWRAMLAAERARLFPDETP